jgi:hypothetical protein
MSLHTAMDSSSQAQAQVQDWGAKVLKWKYGIDVTTATDKDILDYMQTKLYDYMSNRVSDDDLWELFQDDFKDFTTDMFTRNQRETQRLQTCLRCGGVFVASNTKSITIAQKLIDVVNEEEQHKWTETNMKEAELDFKKGPITLVYIGSKEQNRAITFTHQKLQQLQQQ